MGRRQVRKGYFQRQEDKKRDRYKRVVAKQKEKGARPMPKKAAGKGLNYQRDEWVAKVYEPTPVAQEPITGEFAKAWEAHSRKTYLKGWTIGLFTGITLTIAVANVLVYLK